MPIYDFICDDCKHEDERLILKIADLDTYKENCPCCVSARWHRTFKKAPAGKMKRDHAGETGALQHSLKERFVASGGMDDMRHKHGREFDDSIRGAAVDRIKRGEA